MNPQDTHNWNASAFFENLTERNRLARAENFTFCRVSGFEGFEEALHTFQSAPAIVAVSDTSEGYMDMNNTPRTRRIKTVFLAMRHTLDDMEARQGCFRHPPRTFPAVHVRASSGENPARTEPHLPRPANHLH